MAQPVAASLRLLVSSASKGRFVASDVAAACMSGGAKGGSNTLELYGPKIAALRAFSTSSSIWAATDGPKSEPKSEEPNKATPEPTPDQQPPTSSAGAPSAEELSLRQVLDSVQSGFASVRAGLETAQKKAAEAAKAASASAGLGSESSSSSSGEGTSSSGGDKSTSSSSNGEGAEGEVKEAMLAQAMKEIRATLSPMTGIHSATRRYSGPVADASQFAATAELMLVKEKQSAWQSTWSSIQDKIPFLKQFGGMKVSDSSVYKKGQEMVEDLKEKYETSDHPAVHKVEEMKERIMTGSVEEMKERIMTGSEVTRAMSEIRCRDPHFDMNKFVKCIKFDAPDVTKAFLHKDLKLLEEHCGPELLERFGAIEDPTILHTSEVEIVEVRLMDDDPFIISQFNCQQLKCTRDKFGNVIEGSPDSIQRVFYFWGLQMEKSSIVTPDGKVIPPRWVIKDMMWQSMLALV
eukprot:gene7995-1222_t